MTRPPGRRRFLGYVREATEYAASPYHQPRARTKRSKFLTGAERTKSYYGNILSDEEISRAGAELRIYQRNNTLSQLLERYGALIEHYKWLKSDYEVEREARERYKQIAKGQDRNPFALVLIDGDGYVFKQNVEKINPDAGRVSAQLLHDCVRESLRRKGLEHCAIMVRIYANVGGLSKILSKTGVAGMETRALLSHFVANFNKSYGLFDFVDAGPLKENADFKVRAMLKLHAENPQCKHIYFAGCHDVGYISELTSFVGKKDLFTLLKAPGIYFHDEYTKLDLGVEELYDVFRPTLLQIPEQSASVRGVAAGVSFSQTETSPMAEVASKIVKAPWPDQSKKSTTSNTRKLASARQRAKELPKSLSDFVVCRDYLNGYCRFGERCRNLHIDLPLDSTGQAEWPDPPSHITSPEELRNLLNKEDSPPGHVAVNEAGSRLDPYMSPSNVQAVVEVTKSQESRVSEVFHLTPKGGDDDKNNQSRGSCSGSTSE
ncbi:hypothetical protein PpBr36_04152 [Pyricularia pennisetigena]|uniref:hypothetical protein n=1 Tax=Pyricularia pennisetigena TaxID=1578925 RepID=UPI00114F4D46|nr:hypothetical protein PpBr36_04152 [Pyricularia pennisetigena]TLS26324.1 hypothetical protein PpBr36_04152 [Pyricularia pennisetigena]